MKKKLLAIAVLVICLSIISAGTWAVFTAEGRATNVITTGSIVVELNEWADADKTEKFKDVEGVMPGTEVTKIVEVENKGTGDAWVRVWLNVSVAEKLTATNKAPVCLPLTIDVDGNEVDVVELDLNLGDAADQWTYNEADGYYYYNSKLGTTDDTKTTKPLFTTVEFHPNMGNEYQNCQAIIDVAVEAVQVANNGTSAMTALGWPEA